MKGVSDRLMTHQHVGRHHPVIEGGASHLVGHIKETSAALQGDGVHLPGGGQENMKNVIISSYLNL